MSNARLSYVAIAITATLFLTQRSAKRVDVGKTRGTSTTLNHMRLFLTETFLDQHVCDGTLKVNIIDYFDI